MNCNIAVMRWTTIPAKNEIVMIPMPKSGKNSILFTPLNSVGVRPRAALKLKIANGIWQVRATPLHQPPNGFGRRLYCQQENRNDGIGEGENGVAK